MIRLVVLLAVLCPGLARAETARVISGEHADFTRLVVELPTASDWTVGRTSMGYAFASAANPQPGYDLSRVWDRIPRTRLQALRVDPDSGALILTLACPCHVFPFEYRPGVVVLDIKDGPAPTGSAFEAPFHPTESLELPPMAGPSGYDWLDPALRSRGIAAFVPDFPLAPPTLSLDPLREELLAQISRGAAQGLVDMGLPGKPLDPLETGQGVLPWAQIRIGELPGVAVVEADTPQPDAPVCALDSDLAISDWGADRPPLDLLAEARAGLYGEFDAVDPEAVLHSVRLHLYLGFGAEAAQYAGLLAEAEVSTDQANRLVLYRSMARLVDGESDPTTPFARMLGCDGTAALWAALAHDRFPPGMPVNDNAVLRGFLALPPHLRHALGPDLAEAFRAADNARAAQVVHNAIRRTPHVPPEAVLLLDAAADLAAQRPAEARAHAAAALGSDAADFSALVALVEAHFRDLTPLDPEVASAIDAFAGEIAAKDDREAIRARVLSLVLSGRADAAFALAPADEALVSDLWQAARALADDDAFLRHAVVSGPTPPVAEAVALGVAERLAGLGFADAALAWLGPTGPADTADRRRLAAQAELLRGDARTALELLQGLTEPEAESLRARALVQIGAFAEARQAYIAAGMTDEAGRLAAWNSDWDGLGAAGAIPWAEVAPIAAPPIASGTGPLARGAALVEESAKSRAAIDALLASVAGPEP